MNIYPNVPTAPGRAAIYSLAKVIINLHNIKKSRQKTLQSRQNLVSNVETRFGTSGRNGNYSPFKGWRS